MNKNSRTQNKLKVLGRILLLAISLLVISGEILAQDYQMTLTPRRLGHQLGVEVWVKTLNSDATPLGDITVPVSYNREYLDVKTGDRNQPSTITDAVYNNPDMSPTSTDPYLPYYFIESQFSNVNGYRQLSASVAIGINENIATLHARLDGQNGGVYPSEDGKGTFIGMLRFTIKKSIILTNESMADFAFYSGSLGLLEVLDASRNNVTSEVEFVTPEQFAVRGITILNPTDYQTVNRYPAVPYKSMGSNYGYPIYFERSGLLEPDTAVGVYGTPRYAYQISYSLNNGVSYLETGRVAESRLGNSAMSTEAQRNANFSGMVDFYNSTLDYYITTGSGKVIPTDVPTGADLKDEPDGPGLDTLGYGGVLRVIWKADPNFSYRSEDAKIKITLLKDTIGNNIPLNEDARPYYRDPSSSGASLNSFVLGRIFFAQLNGECQYFRSERDFSTPSLFTIAAWVNLNANNGVGSQPGIIATSSGSEAPAGAIGGGWMLYLDDGIYPAFRVREREGGGWLADIRSSQPIGVYDDITDGKVNITDNYSKNWTHIAATVNSNVVTLYVDGEQVAQAVIQGANARPLDARQPIWVGVNPDNEFISGMDFLFAGLKEVQVWKVALNQDQLRQYISGIPAPTRASADTSFSVGTYNDIVGLNDPKYALSIYANLQGIISDIATEGLAQDFTNNLNYVVQCETSYPYTNANNEVIFRPDGSHIKLTSPKCGEGVSNLKGKTYQVRWTAYGIGSLYSTTAGEPGDVTIQITRDNGNNWFDAIGERKYDSATGGTFAVSLDNEEVELSQAIWEPYNNVTLTSIENDIQGMLSIDNNYAKTVKLRITGNANRGQSDIYAESGEFIVAPHFALVNTPTAQITIPENLALNIVTQNAFLEAWISPFHFPVEGQKAPIIVKKDPESGNLHYALRLLPTGQLEFEFVNFDSNVTMQTDYRVAVSDIAKSIFVPKDHIYDSVWYHIGVYLNIPPNGTQSYITFFIDGIPQTENEIRTQLGSNIVTNSKNTYPTFLGYEPNNNGDGGTYFDGAMKEFRFWRNNPGGFSDRESDPNYGTTATTRQLYSFIQGASTVRANELIPVGTVNYAEGLVAAYIMDGGSWVNNGADGTILSYPANTALMARTSAVCGERKYTPTYPYIKLVEPIANQKVGNDETIRVRWIGFDYNRNDLITYTSGYAKKGQDTGMFADLGISDGSGGGVKNGKYPPVASMKDNSSFTNSMLLLAQANQFEFQGTKSKSQYAALLDMSIANSDVKRDNSFDEQGKVPPVQSNGRLQLFARANINSPTPLEYANGENGKDGLIKGLMSESPIFSITPPSNFTVRVLLEGYHKGIDSGIVGNLGTTYEDNGLRIRFYEDAGGVPGSLVPNTLTINKSNYTVESKNTANRGRNQNNFANIPFTLTEAIDSTYFFVVVDNLNYLPVMSVFPALFRYAGDIDTSWSVESGWDFQSWNGADSNKMNSNDNIGNPMGTMSAYQQEYPTANPNSPLGTWTLTPLNFNEGYSKTRYNSSTLSKALPAMVGGDVNKNGVIDVTDFQQIRDAAMSYDPRFSLRGSGEPANAVDRTIVDNNMGKATSLRSDIFPEIYKDLYPNSEDGGLINSDDVNVKNAEYDRINAIVNDVRNAKIKETFEAGIDYVVSATREVVNNEYVDVSIYIQNLGDIWSMANCSYPIEYDPTVLSFNGLVHKGGVLFHSNSQAGYSESEYAPGPNATDPVPNTYSVEIKFDASTFFNPNGNPGVEVPNQKTYLGTLRFNLLSSDESIFFRWSRHSAVLAVDGRDLKNDGKFEDIEPIIVNKNIEFETPYCGDKLDGGTTTTISWITPLISKLVNLEYSPDNGSNWTLITLSPIQITLHSYMWSVPFINSNNCIVRISDAATKEELARSCAFSINIAPTEINRPSAADPVYIANAKEYIQWICFEQINVYFEFSENGTNGWVKVTDIVSASLGQTLWTVRTANTCNAVIRMVNAQTGAIVATSEPFKVAGGNVTLTSPNKGDKFVNPNANITINWTSKQVTEFTLQYTTDGGANWEILAKNVKASLRKHIWKSPNINSSNVIVRAINPSNECIEYGRTGMFSIGLTNIEYDIAEGNSIANITPNPVSSSATIKYIVANGNNTTIAIYDVQGNKILDIVNNEYKNSGTYEFEFDASKLANGVYAVQIQIGDAIIVKEFVVAK